jgi:hypothetical protein
MGNSTRSLETQRAPMNRDVMSLGEAHLAEATSRAQASRCERAVPCACLYAWSLPNPTTVISIAGRGGEPPSLKVFPGGEP